ncbi:MAG: urocanate hydratase [Myxococcota bacterium]|jgi:urocanate hydratase|nr:urocanate hydratase [Myxococcota bacterium]
MSRTRFQEIRGGAGALTEEQRLRLELQPPEIPPLPAGEAACRPTTRAGWPTEAVRRALISNLHMGADWRTLYVYGGSGQAVRDWQAFHQTLALLDRLRPDETLFMQSGVPYGVMQTGRDASRVVITNSVIVPSWTQDFPALRKAGLTMYGQMTAGSWIFIGLQGILQGTFETIAAAIRTAEAAGRVPNPLDRALVVTAGLGLMSGAQPLAIKMCGKLGLVAEVDEGQIDECLARGYLDEKLPSVDAALARVRQLVADGVGRGPIGSAGRSLGVHANAVELLERLLQEGITPLVVTDQTSAHEIGQIASSGGTGGRGAVGYAPLGLTVPEITELKRREPLTWQRLARQTAVRHVQALQALQRRGAEAFDYGNNLRAEAEKGGLAEAWTYPGFVPAYIRPLFCEGKGPFRWAALSNDPEDIRVTDAYAARLFADDPQLTAWLAMAGRHVPFERGLPARVFWAGFFWRAAFGLVLNALVAEGKLKAPVIIGRDHLDGGSVASPNRETEGMQDGSDAIGDYPVLNLVGNALCGATWVSFHEGGGVGIGNSLHAGQVCCADGTPEAGERLFRVLTFDPLTAILRHAHAGYPRAQEVADSFGLWSPGRPVVEQDYDALYRQTRELVQRRTGLVLPERRAR